MAEESQLTFSDIGNQTNSGTYSAAISLVSTLFDTTDDSITITTPNTDDTSDDRPTYIVKTPPDSKLLDVSEHPDVRISSIHTEQQEGTAVIIATVETTEYTLKIVFPNEHISQEQAEETDQNRSTYEQFKFKEFVDAYT